MEDPLRKVRRQQQRLLSAEPAVLGSLVAPLHMRPACSLASATHFLPALTDAGREEEFQAFTAVEQQGSVLQAGKKIKAQAVVAAGRRRGWSKGRWRAEDSESAGMKTLLWMMKRRESMGSGGPVFRPRQDARCVVECGRCRPRQDALWVWCREGGRPAFAGPKPEVIRRPCTVGGESS